MISESSVTQSRPPTLDSPLALYRRPPHHTPEPPPTPTCKPPGPFSAQNVSESTTCMGHQGLRGGGCAPLWGGAGKSAGWGYTGECGEVRAEQHTTCICSETCLGSAPNAPDLPPAAHAHRCDEWRIRMAEHLFRNPLQQCPKGALLAAHTEHIQLQGRQQGDQGEHLRGRGGGGGETRGRTCRCVGRAGQ